MLGQLSMHKFFIYTTLSLFITLNLSACGDKKNETKAEKKVERPVEYDEYGNKILYTADGERELIDDGCD